MCSQRGFGIKSSTGLCPFDQTVLHLLNSYDVIESADCLARSLKAAFRKVERELRISNKKSSTWKFNSAAEPLL